MTDVTQSQSPCPPLWVFLTVAIIAWILWLLPTSFVVSIWIIALILEGLGRVKDLLRQRLS